MGVGVNGNLITGDMEGGHKLTSAESAKGGVNSGIAKRKRRNLRENLEYLASLKPTSAKAIEIMRKAGLSDDEIDRGAAIAMRIMLGAESGDHKSIAEYMEGTGQKITKNINENHNIEYPPLVDLRKRKKNGEK